MTTDEAHYLARHQPLARLLTRLLDNRDLLPDVDQPREIRLDRTMRHARMQHALPGAYVPCGEHDVARLVEITQAEEDNRVGELFFDAEVLLAKGGHLEAIISQNADGGKVWMLDDLPEI